MCQLIKPDNCKLILSASLRFPRFLDSTKSLSMFQFRTSNVRTRTKKRRYTLVVLYVCIERKVWQWSKGREAKCIPEAPLSNGVQVQLQPNLSIRCCLSEDWEGTFVNINHHSICPYCKVYARTYIHISVTFVLFSFSPGLHH